MNKNNGNPSIIPKFLNLVKSLKKRKSRKKYFKFHILRWTGFLKIPLTALYDENIDRPKLTEQKKRFEYIVPAPTEVGRNNSFPGMINIR